MTTRESTDAPQAFSLDMALPDSDGGDDGKRTEHKGAIYDKLDKTKNIVVVDRYVMFTKLFCYLCSMVSYNLCDNQAITAQVGAATASMGALKEVWRNPLINTYSKYLLFQAIPMNLLLCGCETWSLRQSLLNKLDVYLH
jgi:hypothetical protein